jgi:hypothetical protein
MEIIIVIAAVLKRLIIMILNHRILKIYGEANKSMRIVSLVNFRRKIWLKYIIYNKLYTYIY